MTVRFFLVYSSYSLDNGYVRAITVMNYELSCNTICLCLNTSLELCRIDCRINESVGMMFVSDANQILLVLVAIEIARCQ